MSAVKRLLDQLGPYLLRKNVVVGYGSADGVLEVIRTVDGKRRQTVITSEELLACNDVIRHVVDRIDRFVTETNPPPPPPPAAGADFPRGMVAGYCGTPRFLGRRCAI